MATFQVSEISSYRSVFFTVVLFVYRFICLSFSYLNTSFQFKPEAEQQILRGRVKLVVSAEICEVLWLVVNQADSRDGSLQLSQMSVGVMSSVSVVSVTSQMSVGVELNQWRRQVKSLSRQMGVECQVRSYDHC